MILGHVVGSMHAPWCELMFFVKVIIVAMKFPLSGSGSNKNKNLPVSLSGGPLSGGIKWTLC